MKRKAAALTLAAGLAVVGACGAETRAGKDKSPGTAAAIPMTSTARSLELNYIDVRYPKWYRLRTEE